MKHNAGKPDSKHRWLEIKREYISDPTANYVELAKKYDVPYATLKTRATKDQWAKLKTEITKASEQKMLRDVEKGITEMKERHLKIGKLLQKLGLEAIEKGKYVPKSAKEARQFVAEGVRMEREASGANRSDIHKPAVVNIITQERDIINQYLEDVVEGEVVPDGESKPNDQIMP